MVHDDGLIDLGLIGPSFPKCILIRYGKKFMCPSYGSNIYLIKRKNGLMDIPL